MATVNDILAKKGSEILSIGRTATVLDAAQIMNKHKVGALVVLEKRQIIGIFTERDVLRRVVAKRRDPAKIPIEQVMTTKIACCRSGTPLEEAKSVFKHRRIRHLPVVDKERSVVGMISIGDLNAHEAHAQELGVGGLEVRQLVSKSAAEQKVVVRRAHGVAFR